MATGTDLDFWVDVRLRGFDGRWLAVADLADEPDVGTGLTPQEAVAAALAALGEPLASEMAGKHRRGTRVIERFFGEDAGTPAVDPQPEAARLADATGAAPHWRRYVNRYEPIGDLNRMLTQY